MSASANRHDRGDHTQRNGKRRLCVWTLCTLMATSLSLSGCFNRSRPEPEDPFLAVSNPEAAIEAYQARTKSNPGDARAWEQLGIAYSNLKRYSQSASALEQAVRIEPGRPDTWAMLGLSYRKLERLEDAGLAYGNALQRSPKSSEYLATYRELMDGLGRQKEVVRMVAEHVAYGDTGVELLNRMGKEYLRSGAYGAAEDAATASLQLRRAQPDQQRLLALALERQERYEDALRAYDEALSSSSSDTVAMLGRGRSLKSLARYELADQAFLAVLAVDAQNLEALYGRMQVALIGNDVASASALLHQVLQLAPDAPLLQIAQANVYLKQGHPNQALTMLNMAAEHAGDDPELLMLMAQAYVEAAQPEQALPVLETLPSELKATLRWRTQWCRASYAARRTSQVGETCKDVPGLSGAERGGEGGAQSRAASAQASATGAGRGPTSTTVKTTSSSGSARNKGSAGRAQGTALKDVQGDGGKAGTATAKSGANPSLPPILRPARPPAAVANPDPVRARESFAAGLNAFKGGDLSAAADAFRNATRLDPLTAHYYYNLGVSYTRMNQHELAAEAFKQCLSLNPRAVDALFNLGATFAQMGLYEESIVAYQQVLKHHPQDRDALLSIGGAYEALGQEDRAQDYFRRGGGRPEMEDSE